MQPLKPPCSRLQVRELMRLGFEYAERQEAAGVLDAHFGEFRRSQWPGWQPSQVPVSAFNAKSQSL